MPKLHLIEKCILTGLIRFSVGLESINDILADVAQALEKV